MTKLQTSGTICSQLTRALVLISMLLSFVHCHESENAFLRGTEVEAHEHETILELAKKMKPRPLHHHHDGHHHEDEGGESFRNHQFLHLHHMKSGGTSLSSWIRCGTQRQQKVTKETIPTAGLSECSERSYHRCIDNEDDGCRKRIEGAVTMNFCSPLAVTNYFNWTEADAVTMMRHPVDRVWSMFRFQTKGCFKCTNLTQVYEDIDNGNTEQYGKGVCLPQLSNHITRNLQQKINVKELDNVVMSDEERAADAIDSIRNRMTVVGVIEQLDETVKQMSYTFPWLKEEIEGSDKKCAFPHRNSSPSNNGCLDGKHWDLPKEPDEETRKAIEEHNKLDIMVYEAALARFELQKLAIRLDENEDVE